MVGQYDLGAGDAFYGRVAPRGERCPVMGPCNV